MLGRYVGQLVNDAGNDAECPEGGLGWLVRPSQESLHLHDVNAVNISYVKTLLRLLTRIRVSAAGPASSYRLKSSFKRTD